VPPYVILDKTSPTARANSHPIRIGIIGFVPPQIMTWDRRHLEGNVQVRDIVETPRRPGCRRCARRAPRSSSRSAIPASAPDQHRHDGKRLVPLAGSTASTRS
jgi:2',3'-cyclic-nucleotide 2'-phosphodiesterase/3'-nucleotidase